MNEISFHDLDDILESGLNFSRFNGMSLDYHGEFGGVYAASGKDFLAYLRVRDRFRTRGPRIWIQFNYDAVSPADGKMLISINDICRLISESAVPQYFSPDKNCTTEGMRFNSMSANLRIDYAEKIAAGTVIDELVDVLTAYVRCII